MSVKRRSHHSSKTFVQTADNAARVKRGRLDGQDKRVQRVMEHLWGDFDAHSVNKMIAKEFKVTRDDPMAWDVARRITEMHCNCEGYTDDCIAKLLEHVLTREPLPMEQRVLWDLERYHYKRKELEFYFVLQPYQPGMSLLWFVDDTGSRVSTPRGITHHTETGCQSREIEGGGCFPFCWISRNELRFKGKCIVALEPQCSRVVSDHVK